MKCIFILLFDVNLFENSFHCSELSVNPNLILIITYQDVVLYDVSRWIFQLSFLKPITRFNQIFCITTQSLYIINKLECSYVKNEYVDQYHPKGRYFFMSTLHILSYDTSKIALLVKTNTIIKHIYGCYSTLLIPADRKMLQHLFVLLCMDWQVVISNHLCFFQYQFNT